MKLKAGTNAFGVLTPPALFMAAPHYQIYMPRMLVEAGFSSYPVKTKDYLRKDIILILKNYYKLRVILHNSKNNITIPSKNPPLLPLPLAEQDAESSSSSISASPLQFFQES